jgi:catechol 2,3-dioxygenase-like lactoylglutathione lyase family enzyme
MIDHVSVAVCSLDKSVRFYEAVLGTLGYEKLVVRERTVGFGKRYAEFWLNLRAEVAVSDGAHVCLRAKSAEQVEAFFRAALANGGGDDGAPGAREHDGEGQAYYAAFVRDPDGNRIEAVTFIRS